MPKPIMPSSVPDSKPSSVATTQRIYVHEFDAARRSDDRRNGPAALYGSVEATDANSEQQTTTSDGAEVIQLQAGGIRRQVATDWADFNDQRSNSLLDGAISGEHASGTLDGGEKGAGFSCDTVNLSWAATKTPFPPAKR